MYDIFNLRRASAWLRRSHTHQTSLSMNFVRESLFGVKLFFSRAHKILLAVYAELRKIHTRESSKGYFRGWMQPFIYRAMQHAKLMKEELCKPQIDYFLRYFFHHVHQKKISPEKLPHTLQLDSIFFSDILSLMHLCWWAGFLCIYTMMIFFWNYNGKFLASLFEIFFWANF